MGNRFPHVFNEVFMPTVASPDVYDMGNIIKLRKKTDDNYRITNYIRSNLAVIDLQPVNYHLTLANINKSWGVNYDFENAAEEYNKVLAKYKLKEKGLLRLWLTDDTTVSDNFSNNFNPNIIETGINSMDGLSNTLKTMKKLTKSTGNDFTSQIGDAITDKVNTGIKTANSFLFGDNELAKQLETQALSVSNTVGEVIFKGKHVSLPKIWTSSTYSPTLTVTVKLVSPYGSPKAVRSFIIEPLMYLLALISPKTSDGLSYGLSQPLYVNGHGITNMSLAAVQNVTMRRGGRETSFNIYKQPLILDIMITIQPLADGFASVVGESDDVATIEDSDTAGEYDSTNGPAITTLGNIVQSLRPAPNNIVGQNMIKEQNERATAVAGKKISTAKNAANVD